MQFSIVSLLSSDVVFCCNRIRASVQTCVHIDRHPVRSTLVHQWHTLSETVKWLSRSCVGTTITARPVSATIPSPVPRTVLLALLTAVSNCFAHCLTFLYTVLYTIWDAILMCAQKPTWVSLIYRTETKKWKTEKLKSKKQICYL